MDYPIDFLINCDQSYHNGELPLVSDHEYDLYKTEARKEDPNNPYFKTVGATPTGDKVDLPYILGSLEKMKYDGSMNQWIRVTKPEVIAVSDKLDGCTIYVEYEGGEVIHATTRGDGYVGRDITEKAKIFCPKSPHIANFHLKGEVLATTEVAKSLDYKKSRTFVAGCLNRDGVKNCEHIEPVFYQVLDRDYETYSQHIDNIKSFGLPVVYHELFTVEIYPDIESALATYYKDRKERSKWDIDGLVCVDQFNPNNQDEYYPTNAVAFKVNEEAVRTTVTEVTWEVKRSGKIQPVVHIEPVDISGSEVTKCTGFNYKYIRDNGICEGAEIGIVLSGEIIPYITDVYEEAEDCDGPKYCPSCDARLGVSASGVDLVCLNPSCEGKMIYKLENFLLANGVEEVTHTTIRKLGVSSFIELMELDEFDLTGIEGFGASRVSTIINQIKRVYQTSPTNLLKSFGITGLGKTMSAELLLHYSLADLIEGLPEEYFLKIDGVGEVMAERISQEVPQYAEIYDYLVENGLSFKEAGDTLKGLKVVLTGKSELKRNDIIKMVEEQGGMVKGMSKSVDILATNSPDSQTAKMKKARAYGIKIIGYDELYEMLGVNV